MIKMLTNKSSSDYNENWITKFTGKSLIERCYSPDPSSIFSLTLYVPCILRAMLKNISYPEKSLIKSPPHPLRSSD